MYCNEPFTHFEIKANGDVHICCPGVVTQSIGNLMETPLMQVWNSDDARSIRQSIIDKSYVYCNGSHCALVQKFKDYEKPVLLKPEHKLVMDKGPELYNLGYDRTCNIACRSCRPKVLGLTEDQAIKSDKIQKKLLNHGFRDAKRLVVTGSGDPFASPLYRRLFDEIDFDLCPDLKIRLFTNAMLLDPFRWDQLQIKEHVDEIYVSIDAATPETYEFLRVGARFDVLQKRLQFISDLKTSGKIKIFRISFVVQKENFREMLDFVDMGIKYNCDIIWFSAIRNWGTYTPQEFKKIAVHEIDHPHHKDLLQILRKRAFEHPAVRLNTLEKLVVK